MTIEKLIEKLKKIKNKDKKIFIQGECISWEIEEIINDKVDGRTKLH